MMHYRNSPTTHLVERANLLVELGKLEDANLAVERVLRRHPGHVQAQTLSARIENEGRGVRFRRFCTNLWQLFLAWGALPSALLCVLAGVWLSFRNLPLGMGALALGLLAGLASIGYRQTRSSHRKASPSGITLSCSHRK